MLRWAFEALFRITTVGISGLFGLAIMSYFLVGAAWYVVPDLIIKCPLSLNSTFDERPVSPSKLVATWVTWPWNARDVVLEAQRRGVSVWVVRHERGCPEVVKRQVSTAPAVPLPLSYSYYAEHRLETSQPDLPAVRGGHAGALAGKQILMQTWPQGEISPPTAVTNLPQRLAAAGSNLANDGFAIKQPLRCFDETSPLIAQCVAELTDTQRQGRSAWVRYVLLNVSNGFSVIREQARAAAAGPTNKPVVMVENSLDLQDGKTGKTVRYAVACYRGPGLDIDIICVADAGHANSSNMVIVTRTPGVSATADASADESRGGELSSVALLLYLDAQEAPR